MNSASHLVLAICILISQSAFGQTSPNPDDEYLAFTRATKFVENYKEVAAVSAEVFSARAKGSDIEYAAAMSKVAKADLSAAATCISTIYSAQGLSREDASELTSFFTSPLGEKVLSESQRSHLENIRKISTSPLETKAFSEEERHQLASVYQKPSFQKDTAITTNQAVAKDVTLCIWKTAGLL